MSRGVNKFIGIGTVGQDPAIRYMPNGSAVANLSIAINESWKDKNTGEKQEKTEWVRIVFFNRLAEIVEQYVSKGSKLYIEGKLQTRSWEQDGVKRYTTEIVASEMQMLDSRVQQSGDSTQREQSQNVNQGSQSGSDKPQGGFDNFDDSVPF